MNPPCHINIESKVHITNNVPCPDLSKFERVDFASPLIALDYIDKWKFVLMAEYKAFAVLRHKFFRCVAVFADCCYVMKTEYEQRI